MKERSFKRTFLWLLGASLLLEGLILAFEAWTGSERRLNPLLAAVVDAGVFALLTTLVLRWRFAGQATAQSVEGGTPPGDAKRLRLALEASNTALWDTDMASGKTQLDENWAVMIGGARVSTDTTLRRLFALVHPDERTLVMGALRDVKEGRAKSYRVEHRVRTISGEWIWIETRGRAVKVGAAGEVLQMAGTNTDVTARKVAEVEVRRQKEFLETMHHITLELLERRNINELLQTIVERAASMLDASAGRLLVKNGGVMVVRALTGEPADKVGTHLDREEAKRSWQAHDQSSPVVLRDNGSKGELKTGEAKPEHYVAEFPIMRGAVCLGVLSLSRTEAGHEFRAEDIQRGRLFAQMFSLVIHNAGIYAEALREAEARTQASRDNEEKFREVFDKSPIPIAVTSVPEGKLVAANEAAMAAFGFEGRTFIGRTSIELGLWKDPEDRERYAQQLQENGSIRGYDVTMKNRRGEEREFLMSGSIIQIDGKPHTLSSLLDITERKRAESRFRDLFEFSSDAIVIVDGKTTITDINRRAQQLLGYERSELMGERVEVIVPEDVRQELRQGITHYFTIPGPLLMGTGKGSLQARTKEGRVFPVDISLSPLRSGEEVLVVATLRDTTDQRRAEAQQRALELQLRQAQKMDALGTLAGGIAHDFNNLLTVIIGNTELAARTTNPAENLTAIREAGIRSKDLVAQILTFSRRNEIERVPTRLQTVVEDALKLLRSTIPVMVRIESKIDAASAPVLADPGQIHQVLMNLCTNAWHALSDQNGVIEVSLESTVVESPLAAINPNLRRGPYVRLSVKDNGHGMSAETLERIYEPFFTTKPVGQGTGLGLAVVHGIVREHDGAIVVRSQLEEGTTFELYFPALAQSEIPVPGPAAPSEEGVGERILYVDDDKLVGDALTELLNLMGFRATHKLMPREALALFRERPQDFDLVITDRAMPGMTGGELAGKILEIRPDLPVLLLTGYADPSVEKELRQIGILEVLAKPISAQKLSEAVRRALLTARTKK